MTHRLPIAEFDRALRRRDAAYDGIFYFAVRTTGVFCRPSCSARAPKPENIEYFATIAAAQAAGYRPCKRCRPTQNVNTPPWASELLAEVESTSQPHISEAVLRRRGIDPSTVRRFFQRRFGTTFLQYRRMTRLAAARDHIRKGRGTEHVALATGFSSSSGFRNACRRIFGSPPQSAGRAECIHIVHIATPLGPMTAGAVDRGLCLLDFADPKRLAMHLRGLRTLARGYVFSAHHAVLEQLKEELDRYFAGRLRQFTVPLARCGTPFQERVWEALLRIPYGETRSYAEIAAALGDPRSVRAVGRANGANRLAVILPCHRVVNKNGRLGGYGGGLRRKEFLLRLERDLTTAGR